jgi:hypothetical protein
MKTKLGLLKRNVANALLVTLFMMLILAVSIAGYMAYVQQQNRLGTRSQTWNMAMAVAEAGVEEALEVLNSGVTNGPPSSGLFTSSGWTVVGTSNYVIGPRYLPGGYYYVTNNMANWLHPVITSRGFVQMPAMAQGARQVFFATAGNSTPVLTRAVQLEAFKGSIYLAAMAARHTVNLNGNNGLVNSFDDLAANGLYSAAVASTNGSVASLDGLVNVGNYDIYGNLYVGPTGSNYVGPNGFVTGQIYHDANFTFPDTTPPSTSGYNGPTIPPGTNVTQLSAGSTNFYVSPTTPPTPTANQTITTNTLWFTNSSFPGSPYSLLAEITNHFYTTNTTYITNCASKSVNGGKTPPAPNLVCPGSTPTLQGANWWYIPISGVTTIPVASLMTNVLYVYASYTYALYTGPTYQTNVYDHVICGDYYITSASALSGSTLVACPGSTVVAENGVSMSGQDQMTIAPPPPGGGDAPSLKLYVTGGPLALGGQGILNDGGFAENFSVFCAPDVTQVSISGNGQFIGTVIAPNATINLNGGGNNYTNVIGSLMSDYINVNGHMEFHFPESLSRELGTGRYLVTAWKEIP